MMLLNAHVIILSKSIVSGPYKMVGNFTLYILIPNDLIYLAKVNVVAEPEAIWV